MLTYLALENVCQYEKFELNVGPGLTVVVGPQGSGKTNMWLMALSSVTSDNPLFGTKDMNVRWGAEKLHSAITTRWFNQGSEYLVKRVLNKGKSSFAVNGVVDEKVRREGEITSAMLKGLGVQKDSIMNYCFVPQSKTNALIETLPTDRVRFTASLLGQDWLVGLERQAEQAVKSMESRLSQKIVDDFSNALLEYNRTKAEVEQYSDQVRSVVPRLEAARSSLEAFRAVATRLVTKQDLERRQMTAVMRQQVNRQAVEAATTMNIMAATAKAAALRNYRLSVVFSFRDLLARRAKNLEELKAWQEVIPSRRQWIDTVAAWDRVAEQERQRIGLAARLRSIDAALLDLNNWMTPPICPVDQRPEASLFDELRIKIHNAERRIKLLRSGVAECVTCGAPVQPGENELADLTTNLPNWRLQLDGLSAVERQWVIYTADVAKYNRALPKFKESYDQHVSQRVEVESSLQSMGPVQQLPEWYGTEPCKLTALQSSLREAELAVATRMEREKSLTAEVVNSQHDMDKIPDVEELLLETVVGSEMLQPGYQASQQAAYHQAELQLVSNDARLVAARQESVAIEAELTELAQQLEAFTDVDAGQEVEMRRLQQELDGLERTRLQAELTVQDRVAKVTVLREQVRGLISRLRDERVVMRSRDVLQGVYNEVKPKDLPREVLVSLMQGVGQSMTELCYELGQPFEVTVGNDLEFMIRHPSGRVEPAQRLSCGQGACVSTVFWLVRLLSNMGNSLPLLVMDEPSANMDAAAVARFGEMLQKLGPLLVQRNLQVVLTTHHEQLRGCGQQLVNLA